MKMTDDICTVLSGHVPYMLDDVLIVTGSESPAGIHCILLLQRGLEMDMPIISPTELPDWLLDHSDQPTLGETPLAVSVNFSLLLSFYLFLSLCHPPSSSLYPVIPLSPRPSPLTVAD